MRFALTSCSSPWISHARHVASVLLVGAVLSGCSLWGGSSKPVPADLGPNVPVLGVNHVWTARIGSIAGLPLDMHVSGHVVTLASADGVVVALDARSGADLWRTALGEPLSAGVGSDGKWTAVVSRSNALVVSFGVSLCRRRHSQPPWLQETAFSSFLLTGRFLPTMQ